MTGEAVAPLEAKVEELSKRQEEAKPVHVRYKAALDRRDYRAAQVDRMEGAVARAKEALKAAEGALVVAKRELAAAQAEEAELRARMGDDPARGSSDGAAAVAAAAASEENRFQDLLRELRCGKLSVGMREALGRALETAAGKRGRSRSPQREGRPDGADDL